MTQDDSTSPDTKRSRGSHAAGAGLGLLTIFGGLGAAIMKNADNLVQPLMRSADDVSGAMVRSSGSAQRAFMNSADDASRSTMQGFSAGVDDAERSVMNGAIHTSDDKLKELGQELAIDGTGKAIESALESLEAHENNSGSGHRVLVSGWEVREQQVITSQICIRHWHQEMRRDRNGYFNVSKCRTAYEQKASALEKELPDVTDESDRMPSASLGQYGKFRISPFQSAATINLDSLNRSEVGIYRTPPILAHLEFVEGDWSAYERGEKVKLQFTELGLTEFTPFWEAEFRALLKLNLEGKCKQAIQARYPKTRKIDIRYVIHVSGPENTVLEIHGEQAELRMIGTVSASVEMVATYF